MRRIRVDDLGHSTLEGLGERFGVAPALVIEIMRINEDGPDHAQARWQRVRDWAVENLNQNYFR